MEFVPTITIISKKIMLHLPWPKNCEERTVLYF
jgi:hypothetical protein